MKISDIIKEREIEEYKKDIKAHEGIGAFNNAQGLRDYIYDKYQVKL